jgi:methyl-accepting chemotaxis protein
MKNLRISGKLMISFGGVGLLLVGLIWFMMVQVAAMRDLTDRAVGDRMPKMAQAQHMLEVATKFRTVEGLHILLPDAASMRAAEVQMRDYRKQVDDDLAALEATVRMPEATVTLRNFRKAWQDYLGTNATLLGNSRAQRDAAAITLIKGKSLQQFGTMSAAAGALVDIEKRDAVAAGQAAVGAYAHIRTLAIVAVLAALALLGAILMMLVRQIARPVAAATAALGELATGRMDVAVPDGDRADEVGALARALVGLRDQLAAAERAKAEQATLIVDSIGRGLADLAGGDLVSRVHADLTGPFARLATDFNAAASSLQSTIAQVAKAAAEISSGAGEVRTASDDLSQRTEQQAASLEETAAAMDEITTNVRSTAARSGSANAAVRSARDEAEKSGAVVREAVAAMGGIERTSNEISDIISVIDGIAFQTNLLALNAGVEAARAGDAGRGFAVVASEVRALAQRSADAAKDVKARITASGEQVSAGVRLVGQTGEALTRIIARIGEIDGLVADIAAAADHQATGLQQVNTAVSEMDGVTQQNAAMVEEATAAARSLASEAEGLIRQIARFRTGAPPAAPASPVHDLQARAAAAGRKIARSTPRAAGHVALAAAREWSEI